MTTTSINLRLMVPALLTLLPLAPSTIQAKPGGHRLARHECRATFQFHDEYTPFTGKEPVDLYLSGSGFASFNGVPIYGQYDVRDAVNSPGVAMQWEVNNCFAGNRPEWGIITAIAKTAPQADERSTIIFSADTDRGLFPATSINQLFFEITIPKVGLVIFNKEPIVLRGKTRNIDLVRDVEEDWRVRNRGAQGLASAFTTLLAARSNSDVMSALFEPMGQHSLVKPVVFYRKDDPEKPVCTLIGSEIITQIHYGIDVQCTGTTLDGAFLTSTIEIRNLTDKEEDCIWYVADSHELTIVAVELPDENGKPVLTRSKTGKVRLGKTPFRLRVQAYNNTPENPAGQNACIFCGIQNTPRDLNAFKTEAVSGFLIIQGDDFKRPLNPMEERKQ